MIMDAAANIIVVGPVLIKVCVAVGYPDVQAALIVVVGFLIGTVTPPIGVAYFTTAAIARARLEAVGLAMLPYLAALFLMLFALVLITRHQHVAAACVGLRAIARVTDPKE